VAKKNGSNGNALKVESGFPVPKKRLSKPDLVNTFQGMAEGQSFLYPRNDRNALSTYAKRAGVKITTRTESEEHVRVWRVG
jgi:hypothetical protein